MCGEASQASLHNTSSVWLATSAEMGMKALEPMEGAGTKCGFCSLLPHPKSPDCLRQGRSKSPGAGVEAQPEETVGREDVCNFTHFVYWFRIEL